MFLPFVITERYRQLQNVTHSFSQSVFGSLTNIHIAINSSSILRKIAMGEDGK